MKKLLVVVIVLGILLAAVSVAQAQEDVWIILWWAGADYSVHPDDNVYLAIGWAACNQGLLKSFQNAIDLEITLDGEPFYQLIKKDPYWWPSYPAGPFEECFPDSHASPTGAAWVYPLDLSQFELDEEYEFAYSIWLDHQVTDGFDGDYNGIPDFYGGLLTEESFTLTVESP